MYNAKIDLYEYFGLERKENSGGYLSVYACTPLPIKKDKLRPAAVIIPGGGYKFLSDAEYEFTALKFLTAGYAAFVLNYSVRAAYPAPLAEACMAMAYIRENAEELGVNAWQVAVLGSNSGGHLAALLGTIWNEREVVEILGRRAKISRPDAVILNCPAITLQIDYTNVAMRNIITDGKIDLFDRLSVEKRVSKYSTPAFIWHTVGEATVPAENALLLANAYKREGVPFSLHITDTEKDLGFGEVNGADGGERSGRFALALEWLASRGFGTKKN